MNQIYILTPITAHLLKYEPKAGYFLALSPIMVSVTFLGTSA